jgi:hypothetical protein
MNIEESKLVANEIFGILANYKEGKCSYDRALEDAGYKINELFQKQPIIGYIRADALRVALSEIVSNKKQNAEKSYLFNCQIHQNEMGVIERALNSYNQ